MALMISQTACHIREVRLSHKPEALVSISPKATVPVIVLADGSVIEESIEIMRWALRRHDPEAWLDREDRALITTNDEPFKQHLDRYKYPDRHGSDPAFHRAAGLDILETLETRLATHRNLCGDARGMTDIAIMPFVRQFAQTDPHWFDQQPLPRVREWLARHLESSLFCAAMARYQPWQPQSAPVRFPPD